MATVSHSYQGTQQKPRDRIYVIEADTPPMPNVRDKSKDIGDFMESCQQLGSLENALAAIAGKLLDYADN